ncbi:rCG37656 [Rattus norvegicus]|uniref:RCG37656 n=1 Tax=Rattus norvegicus TaxID=10116 RepID=A6JEZ7_RAT|nr:rCG37656 [Rattus norvegicus]
METSKATLLTLFFCGFPHPWNQIQTDQYINTVISTIVMILHSLVLIFYPVICSTASSCYAPTPTPALFQAPEHTPSQTLWFPHNLPVS